MLKIKQLTTGCLAIAICCLLADFALASADAGSLNGHWMCVQGSEYLGKEFSVRDGAISVTSPEGSAVIGRIERIDGENIYILGESPYANDRIRFMNYNWFAMGEGPDEVVCRREDWRVSLE